jgi:hypothetical protein
MKRLLFVAALTLLGFTGCADENGSPRTYDNNDLELVVGNSARMGCTCMFVMEMDEAFCRAWVKASPDVAKVSFDRAAKKVEAAAFISWAATARFVDEKRGCVIE